MTTKEENIELIVDCVIREHQTTPIQYYPYVSGAVDVYKQRTRTFGTPVTLVGRAIIRPTNETLSVIGNDEQYDIAFLFSRTEMRKKFPALPEGEWMDVTGEMTWFGRRYKIEKAQPTGQVGLNFTMMVIMGKTIQGQRD